MSSAILLGLAFGVRHAVDPDHVAALASLAADERRARDAGFLGASWALGHGVTLAVVGVLLLVLRVSLPDALPRYSEAAAGVLLVVLGCSNLLRCRPSAPARRGGLRQALARSAGVGLVHGLAGSGAVTLVALTAFPDALAGGAYLAAFAVGTALAMVVCSLLLGTPFARLPRARLWLGAVAGATAILLGCGLVWSALLSDLSWVS